MQIIEFCFLTNLKADFICSRHFQNFSSNFMKFYRIKFNFIHKWKLRIEQNYFLDLFVEIRSHTTGSIEGEMISTKLSWLLALGSWTSEGKHAHPSGIIVWSVSSCRNFHNIKHLIFTYLLSQMKTNIHKYIVASGQCLSRIRHT